MTTISVYRASKAIGCHPKRLRKLAHACGLLASEAMALSDDRAMLDVSKDEGFLDRVKTAMSLSEVREYLNIPRPHDRLLYEAGHLIPWIHGGTPELKDHAFEPSTLDAFMSRLLADATPREAGENDLLSIPDAARKANCAAMEIVGLILDGRIVRRRTDRSTSGYLSLLVDPAEIAPLVRLPDHGGVPLREVERRTGIATHTLRKLVDDGHIPSRRVINPVNRCPQDVIEEKEIETFFDRYWTMGRLMTETGLHNRTLRTRLVAAGVAPAFPDVDGSPYEQSVVRAAGILP